jgi:hypothetical protein
MGRRTMKKLIYGIIIVLFCSCAASKETASIEKREDPAVAFIIVATTVCLFGMYLIVIKK